MDVILLQHITKLGQMGDVVKVKPGFARNYLLPHGKALRSTDANKASFEARRVELEARNLELRKEAEAVAEKISGRILVIIRSASDTGSLYGSVTKRDAAAAAHDDGLELDKMQFDIPRPIKELGMHPVSVNLHPEIDVEITLNVARSEDEAKLQEAGQNVTDIMAAEDADEQDAADDGGIDHDEAPLAADSDGRERDEGAAPESPLAEVADGGETAAHPTSTVADARTEHAVADDQPHI